MPRKGLRDRLVREVSLNLERLKKLPNVLDGEMKEIAKEIQQTARNMAPVEYGGLKKAIKVKRKAQPRTGAKGYVKGKSSYYVYIDPMSPAPGHKEGVVGGYVWLVHEHMGWGANVGPIMPSNRSIVAGLMHGEVAGGKFLDRAMNKHRGQIRAKLTRTCQRYINHKEYVANQVDKQ